MAVKTHTCLTLACDVCGQGFEPDDYPLHFHNLTDARGTASRAGWTVTADHMVICADQDDAHQVAIDALMPPEAVMQIPGQLGLDGSEEP